MTRSASRLLKAAGQTQDPAATKGTGEGGDQCAFGTD